MKSILVPVDFSEPDEPDVYIVRLWGPPASPQAAWSVDDWKIVAARDVLEVLEWARSTADGAHLEVFIQASPTSPRLRLLGDGPPDEVQVDVPLTCQ